ncbi:alpha/beta fold hydrolase [Streptomyces sp. NBC_00582]|uniref:alpha/beta fold hydrolase n=1 Tax=Streptomyces sp. NBC_00582 TaxID=2975783 RepID=UPI002E81609F|nr:alpha/beta hydrolase [Streptomyces sp. NBC_00582]WUB60182.1 alpha/beta hydrolase [Streptomyces sp. NBC_00582]
MTAVAEPKYFPSSDGDLAYHEAGEGNLLVLVHSGFVDHRVFDAQIPALAETHRVIAPDVRGHGSSANASRPFRWTDDLAELLRHLDAGPAVLVGVSMGGVIVSDTLLEHPELVRAAVVCGASTGEFQDSDPWHQRIQAEIARTLAVGDLEGWLKAFLAYVPGPHRTLDAIDPDIPRRLREMALHTLSKHTPGEKDRLVRVTDTWSRVPKIDVPVLTLNGALDTADVITAAQRLADSVRHGRAVLIDGVAHYPNMERPQEFTAAIRDFLTSL